MTISELRKAFNEKEPKTKPNRRHHLRQRQRNPIRLQQKRQTHRNDRLERMVSFAFQFGENSFSLGDDAYVTMRDFVLARDYSEKATRTAFAMYMGSRALDGTIARLNDTIEMFLHVDYNRSYDYTRP